MVGLYWDNGKANGNDKNYSDFLGAIEDDP